MRCAPATTPACRCCRPTRPTWRRASRCTAPTAPSPSEEGAALAPVQRRVIEHALRDFRLAGVGLTAERKERFKTVMLELTQLQAKFEENVLDATNGWTLPRHRCAASCAGLNDMLIEQARRRAPRAAASTGWLLTLDQPTYVAVVTDAESEPLRRAFYEAWTTRASDQGPNAGRWDNSAVMEEILRLRHEAARLLDFRNYAEYALATRMAHSVEEVLTFLHELARAARAAARARVRRARGLRRAASWPPGTSASTPSGCSASASRVSQEELRPYFPLPRVLAGLFEVAERLFGVTHPRARRARRCGTRTCASSRSRAPAAQAGRQLLPRCLRAPQQAQRRLDGRVRRPQAPGDRRGAAGGLPGVQLPAAGAGSAGAAHARRRADAVPRVRPRAAPPADARRLPEHRRHQRRGLGRGGAAEPVPRELRLAPGGAAAHLRPLRDRRAAARRDAGAPDRARAASMRACR